MKQPKKFSQWWKGVRKKPKAERQEIIGRWLNYATRTASLVHDQNVQRVIYTIRDRYHKSKYKRITATNARKVYYLINIHQDNYRQHIRERDALRKQIQRLTTPNQNTVIKRTRHKTIHRGPLQ